MQQFSREELAERSGASITYVDRLVGLGILDRRPDPPQFATSAYAARIRDEVKDLQRELDSMRKAGVPRPRHRNSVAA